MAKITVVGDAVVVTSSLTKEDILTVAKYRGSELAIVDDEGEPIFVIGATNAGTGAINQFGVSFGGETHDGEKKATVTMIAPHVEGDIREWIADRIGSAIVSLRVLEQRIPEVLASISSERATIMEDITIA